MTNKENNREIVMAGWHLKKEVTIGQLVTLFSILITGIWWASNVENKLMELASKDEKTIEIMKMEDSRIEEKTNLLLKNMDHRFDRYQASVASALTKIDASINKLSDKIDKKADK